MKPIRVLCVFSTLDRGGAESMCMNLYRNIDRTQVQFDFVKHTKSKGAFEDEIVSLGGTIFTAPRFFEINYFQYISWWKDHFRKHPEHKIIHGHFFGIASVYFKAAHEFNCITIAHSHCAMSPLNGGGNKIKALLKQHHINKLEDESDYCFACSKSAGEWMFKRKTIIVLNNAIDINEFNYNLADESHIRTELNLLDKFVVGTVGNISYPKNPMGIVKIFNEIAKRIENAMLLWVGNNSGKPFEEAVLLSKNLRIYDKIIWTGRRNDVNKLLQAMDCFILPSIYEGLPVVAVEAQASGLKCFISNKVTRDVDVTERSVFLPIDDYKIWAEEIINSDLKKEDTIGQIMAKGYAIQSTSQWLQNFYLELVK